MTLPTSGSISFANINTELGNSSNATLSLNSSNIRYLAANSQYSGADGINPASGSTISMYELRGATKVTYTSASLSGTIYGWAQRQSSPWTVLIYWNNAQIASFSGTSFGVPFSYSVGGYTYFKKPGTWTFTNQPLGGVNYSVADIARV